MQPAPETAAYDEYVQWMHYAEGSAMLPLMLNLYAARLGDAAAPLMPRVEGEIANHLAYIDGALKGRQFIVGDTLSGADIQMSFVGEVAGAFGNARSIRTSTPGPSGYTNGPRTRRRLRRGEPTTSRTDA